MAKDPRLTKIGATKYNQPKRTPKHKTKSHAVVAKVKNTINRIAKMLAEDDEKDKSDPEDDIDIESDIKEKLRKAQTREKRGIDGSTNYAAITKKDKDDRTGMKREISDLKKSWKSTDINEEHYRDDLDLDEYLDNKIQQNASMTNRIKSTLNSLSDHINSKPHIISESNNLPGEKDD